MLVFSTFFSLSDFRISILMSRFWSGSLSFSFEDTRLFRLLSAWLLDDKDDDEEPEEFGKSAEIFNVPFISGIIF